MGWYAQSRRQYSSLNKLINGLIFFIIMAIMGFSAIPSFMMSDKKTAKASRNHGSKNRKAVLPGLKNQKKYTVTYTANHGLSAVSGVTRTVGLYDKPYEVDGNETDSL